MNTFSFAPGIPSGYAYPSLYFNAASDTLLVTVHRTSTEDLPPRDIILWRALSNQIYTSIFVESENHSQEQLVVSVTKPVAFFSTHIWRKSKSRDTPEGPEKESWGGDWHSLSKLDLIDKSIIKICEKGSVKLPTPYSDFWISDLIQVTPENDVILVAGLSQPDQGSVTYVVGHLATGTTEFQIISELHSPFA
ncbi:MAG: hypothetical protein ACKV19_16200 [Verrucomicrobiales bacterium]